MHIKKTKKVQKEVEEIIEDYYECDKCGERIIQEEGDAFDMEFEIKTGEYYLFDGGGSGDKWELDLCESCSLNLVKKLKEEGYKVRKEEWDY